MVFITVSSTRNCPIGGVLFSVYGAASQYDVVEGAGADNILRVSDTIMQIAISFITREEIKVVFGYI